MNVRTTSVCTAFSGWRTKSPCTVYDMGTVVFYRGCRANVCCPRYTNIPYSGKFSRGLYFVFFTI